MIVFKKNQIVTITMVCLVVVAGYLNFVYTKKAVDMEENTVTASADTENEEVENYGEAQFVNATNDAKTDYFNETKLNKEISRSEALSLIREIAESDSSDAEAKKTAQQSMIKMAGNIEKEANIENILTGKGFSKVSVYINDSGVTTAVLTDGLKPEDVAKIRDVIISETGVSAEKIKIMEIK